MRVSLHWLADWVPALPDAGELAERLTLAGLEVEGVEPAGSLPDGVVAARIISAEPHPQADRLRVCQVDDGSGETLQIVCGAPNARAGLVAPLARLGARLPGGMTIKPAQLRGVESQGMLCSGEELGLQGTAGLLELDTDSAAGTPLSAVLGLDDEVLDIALTPNRGDCLSVRGVARELAGILDRELAAPVSLAAVAPRHDERREVRIEEAADCSAYAGRILRGVDPAAATPLWMRERLRRAGLRSIDPLVDVTNYVLLELGQPMHAFDLARLEGNITVRRGREGEALTLLNDQRIELGAEELVIADDSGPVALAGAMGGAPTAIGEATRDVFLESACFAPHAVAGTGRKFKLSSDSLHRFERGVDPALQVQAIERATALLIEIAGGEPGPVVLAGTQTVARPAVALRLSRLQRLLGVSLPEARVRGIFERLGCSVQDAGEATLSVQPPSHRYDIEIEEDLVEEVARIHGYEQLPGRERRVPMRLTAAEERPAADAARDALVARGYYETVSYSFVAADHNAALADGGEPVVLDNPMAATQAQMRQTVWASLLPVWQHNVQRQQARARLFECARIYFKKDSQIIEKEVVAGIASGESNVEQWGLGERAVDFFDVKADLEALLAELAGGAELDWRADRHPALQPGQTARLSVAGTAAGWLGRLHPAVAKKLDLPGTPLLFELDWELISRARPHGFEALAEFPSTRRDLALVVPEEVPAGALRQALERADIAGLQAVRVFDLYRGEALSKGFKSVALGLIFQEKTRTLVDGEVDAAVADAVSRLEQGFGARIRD